VVEPGMTVTRGNPLQKTVMTAGLVTGLWMVADDQLTSLLSKAINSVSN